MMQNALLSTSSRNSTWFCNRHTVGQIYQKCEETSNLMWLSLIWFILFLFVCSNLFCTIANFRIKCVTETKHVSVLFYKNLKSSFLHDSHIWLWGFFTFLVDLAQGASSFFTYGNMGCRVFKGGIQNYKGFCEKILKGNSYVL